MTIPEILSIISPVLSVVCSFILNYHLMSWRISKLEEHIKEHNKVLDRMQVVEGKVEVMQNELYQKRYN